MEYSFKEVDKYRVLRFSLEEKFSKYLELLEEKKMSTPIHAYEITLIASDEDKKDPNFWNKPKSVEFNSHIIDIYPKDQDWKQIEVLPDTVFLVYSLVPIHYKYYSTRHGFMNSSELEIRSQVSAFHEGDLERLKNYDARVVCVYVPHSFLISSNKIEKDKERIALNGERSVYKERFFCKYCRYFKKLTDDKGFCLRKYSISESQVDVIGVDGVQYHLAPIIYGQTSENSACLDLDPI